MVVETIKMSSKGQIVIPQEIREKLHAGEGSIFSVVNSKDAIILKKVITPSKEELIRELESISREGKKRLLKKGIKEANIPHIVHKSRRK